MKWTTPQIGDEREIKKFAFLPTYCGNGLTIWFEFYIAKQRYSIKPYTRGWETKQIKLIKQRQ